MTVDSIPSHKRRLSAEAPKRMPLPPKDIPHNVTSIEDRFAPNVLADRETVKAAIAAAEPYTHGCIPALFSDTLLRRVRDEIAQNLHFTKKETDIYKLFQSGDLRNLSGLDDSDRSKLANLFDLREALYSQQFRDYVSYVTGCGALSGVKQDLSMNVYQKSCHLLTHDDVIGSRRISFILYMPDPDEPWVYPEYGGALRFYPTIKPNVPAADWTKVVPPAWNQFAFFTVQPGISFHDVEEVYVDRERMSVQGWFHIPQKGEEAYIEGEMEATEAKSTLQMLETDEVAEYDYPRRNYVPVQSGQLSAEHRAYLGKFLNPTLLQDDAIATLNEFFCEESTLEIKDFLNAEYAKAARTVIDTADMDTLPKTSRDVDALPDWKLAGPPHKCRYMYLDGRATYAAEDSADLDPTTPTEPAAVQLAEIATMLQSPAFTAWLAAVSNLTPAAARVLARRFRPALDYTLATGTHASHPSGMALEGTLDLTPTRGWDSGEAGGYELTMVTEETEGNDPAVYRLGADDGEVMVTSQAAWNVFSLVVRDAGVLRFVKYVSGAAPGSRWDVVGEWKLAEESDEPSDDETASKQE